MRQQLLFYDFSKNLVKISEIGDSLEKLDEAIDWSIFRKKLKAIRKNRTGTGGRPAFDEIIMFKALVLQQLYELSDDQIEFQIRDRLSFMRFPGVHSFTDIPDSKTTWLFREKLGENNLVRKLFDLFSKMLDQKGLGAQKGHIIDATIVSAPKQRNSRKENLEVKNGTVPDDWKKNPHKLAQKDIDARWLKKNGERYFGYKNHVVADVKGRFVRDYSVSPASAHDSQAAPALLSKIAKGDKIYGDSAYHSDEISEVINRRKLNPKICSKGKRGAPLTQGQMKTNRKISKIRSRIERIFGRMTHMNNLCVRTIGGTRAATCIGFQNLVYNMDRYAYLTR
ncbi:MAG: IS5 family transposase [Spirochaetia bacterium]|nr:IS5 family transposase [Spirochaetia bacterium]